MIIGVFETFEHPDGFLGIRHCRTKEMMHSGCEPLPQAEALYIHQTRLHTLLNESSAPIVIWDVGLGGGINATAAIKTAQKLKKEILLISFEIDLNPLRLVLNHSKDLPNPGTDALSSILELKEWKSDFVTWKLLEGNFVTTIKHASKPQVVFWDPFSLKTDSEMWLGSTLSLLTEKAFSDEIILSTYSSATRFRAALLSLGWWVSKGIPISGRAESTIAGSKNMFKRLSIAPLSSDWLLKFNTSSAQFPLDWENSSDRKKLVIGHEQFCN